MGIKTKINNNTMDDRTYYNDEWNIDLEKPNYAHYDDEKQYQKDMQEYLNKKEIFDLKKINKQEKKKNENKI